MSLVEVMVAMAIGLFIVLIATTLYVSGTSNVGFRMAQSENLGNGRYALGALDAEFTKAGYRRDPTQSMDAAFPADPSTLKNDCQFNVGEAVKVLGDGSLCIRFQPRDNDEKDCAGSAAGIATLKAYDAPPAPALGAGLIVEKYSLSGSSLVCQSADPALQTPVQVADGVSGILFEFGVGKIADAFASRTVDSYKTTTPTATEAIRSLRYAVLLTSSAKVTGGMESSVCTRWTELGGDSGRCSSNGQLYQLASGSLTLRNLMP